MKKSVKFYTLGCKTNQYETQAIREDLVSSGFFKEAKAQEKVDLYVINTCTVTAKADRDSRWTIRRCHKENPNAKIIVTGCLAEMDKDMIKDLPGVSSIAKNSQKHKISEILNNEIVCEMPDYTPLKISSFEDRTRAFVKIQDGCDNFCSYCKVPLVRGRSRSRELSDILEEVRRLLDKGFKELILTGICLGAWGRDLKEKPKLPILIKRIVAIDKDFRLRLSSIEPNMVTDELIDSIARSNKVCPHLHIPLQSGSDRILNLMNRPYTAKDYIKLIKRIRKMIPEISITSDVMVGFPGESRRDFNQTLKVLRDIKPSRLHIFTYSKREGTAATRFKDDLSLEEAKKRRGKLEDMANTSSYRYRKGYLNKRVEGLIETKRDPTTNFLTGYTDAYIRFLLDGPDSMMGKLLPLKAFKVDIKSTFCRLLQT